MRVTSSSSLNILSPAFGEPGSLFPCSKKATKKNAINDIKYDRTRSKQRFINFSNFCCHTVPMYERFDELATVEFIIIIGVVHFEVMKLQFLIGHFSRVQSGYFQMLRNVKFLFSDIRA